jgi:NAD(P)-dependent dehydrogenase (short-subunit alcohol dehydrogenase family)
MSTSPADEDAALDEALEESFPASDAPSLSAPHGRPSGQGARAGAGRLDGKICILTGSGGGIGRAAALRFAAEGARVVGADVSVAGAEETVRQVEAAGGEIVSIHPCDLTRPEDCRRLVSAAVERFGRLDVLFNNGAMAYFDWIETMSDETWHRTINEELNLVFNLTKAAWPYLSRQGGAIVNTASANAWIGYRVLPALAHSAAKGGVLSMTRHLAMEGRTHGIRANSISPGVIETNQTRPLLADPGWRDAMLGRIMLDRLGRSDEVAAAAAFLASDDASYITGVDLRIDGGTMAW